jgi:hypothetical protein
VAVSCCIGQVTCHGVQAGDAALLKACFVL